MPRAFSQIAYTPAVRAAQARYGSRAANAGFDDDPEPHNRIGAHDADFIRARDSFYLASVGANGWPYVQHRGGPPGFLRVLDERTLGFADFSGNRQYISAGNVSADGRVMLFLMDYAHRRRLKLWGRARIVHEAEDPALIARLEDPGYRARIERGVLIDVEALDYNCPQHITPRYSSAEVAQQTAALQAELDRLRAGARLAPAAFGAGPLPLVVTGLRQLAPDIRAYELRHAEGLPLPVISAGAHLQIPLPPDGEGGAAYRSYSIASDPARRDVYEIAVLRQQTGRGGSRALHRALQLGTVLHVDPPVNAFPLQADGAYTLLIAGGIGITAIKPMAQALAAQGRPFELHYAVRTRARAAWLSGLERRFPQQLRFWASGEGQRLDLERVFAAAPADSRIYVCGPEELIADARRIATARGIPAGHLRCERFTAGPGVEDRPLTLVLARSGRRISVAATQTLLEALEDAAVAVPAGCRAGSCGSCAVKLLAGEPEHRDQALGPREREQAALFCPCVSRARSPELVLDL